MELCDSCEDRFAGLELVKEVLESIAADYVVCGHFRWFVDCLFLAKKSSKIARVGTRNGDEEM